MPLLNQFEGWRNLASTGSSGGGGGTNDASFIVLGLDSHLTAERVITGTPGVITLVDNGPESTLIIGIADNGVSLELIQQIPANTLLGRGSGAGDVQALTVGSGLQITGGALSTTGGSGANTGITTLDFGPDTDREVMAQVLVTGQTGIVANSIVLVEVRVAATIDHSADETRVENLKVTAGTIVPGVGFTVYGEITRGKTYGHFDVNWSWQ